ncbi:MAG TPA: ROK family protein [Candidatus Methylomirabilis sp.]|nr:ROK family protein [Candidatus Methylomirabilis sp.]
MPDKKQYTIGIDIGGTNIKSVLFNGEKVVMDYSLGTPKDSLEHLIIMIFALIEPLTKKAEEDKVKISGVGLGVPGIVDPYGEKIIDAPNLPMLNGIKLAEILAKRINLPVKMDNDTECFLRAEATLGTAAKYKNIYGITVGTGIGGAWWTNGNIYYGAHGFSEPGRMIIDFHNQTNLETAYQKLTQNNPRNLAMENYRGDELARKSFVEVGQFLGLACANIINLLDPEAIVFGGGVMESSDLFLSALKKTIDEKIIKTSGGKTKILKGKLGLEAGAIGAALLIS